MQDDDDCRDEFDGGGRIIAKIPFGADPSADDVWKMYKRARSSGIGLSDYDEAPSRPRYQIKRRGPDSLYLSFKDYSED